MDLSEIFQGRPSDAKWQALGEYLLQGTVRGGPGVRVRQVGNKTIITAKRQHGGVAGELRPLTLKNGSDVGKFQVIPGYVNSIMPTLSATALDAGTPPEITVTADVWVWIKTVGTFGTGSGGEDEYTVTIETSASNVVPSGTAISDTGFTSFRAIGKVDFTAASGSDPATYVITNFHNGGNLSVDSFGNVNLWWLA